MAIDNNLIFECADLPQKPLDLFLPRAALSMVGFVAIGFDFIFVTSAKTDAQAKAMLKALGMPFRDNVKEEAAA